MFSLILNDDEDNDDDDDVDVTSSSCSYTYIYTVAYNEIKGDEQQKQGIFIYIYLLLIVRTNNRIVRIYVTTGVDDNDNIAKKMKKSGVMYERADEEKIQTMLEVCTHRCSYKTMRNGVRHWVALIMNKFVATVLIPEML